MYWWRGNTLAVFSNASAVRNVLFSICLEINNSKYELFLIKHKQETTNPNKQLFQDQFPSLSIPDPNHWHLLGSPVSGTCPTIGGKTNVLDSITENLKLIETYQALFIFKNYLSIPKLIFAAYCLVLQVQRGTGCI